MRVRVNTDPSSAQRYYRHRSIPTAQRRTVSAVITAAGVSSRCGAVLDRGAIETQRQSLRVSLAAGSVRRAGDCCRSRAACASCSSTGAAVPGADVPLFGRVQPRQARSARVDWRAARRNSAYRAPGVALMRALVAGLPHATIWGWATLLAGATCRTFGRRRSRCSSTAALPERLRQHRLLPDFARHRNRCAAGAAIAGS